MNRRDAPAGVRSRLRDAFVRRVGVDARALAALRISLGLLLLADLFLRSLDLVAFYTDAGVLPRSALREAFPAFAALSIHALSGDAWFQAILFLVAAGFALALLFGYRTRLATLASLVLLVSIQARNPMVLNAGDSVLRRLLFWSLFLPLGGRWSVDVLRGEESSERVASAATAAFLVQVVIVYAANGLFKLRGELWLRGDAIQYVFSLDQLTVRLGDALAGYPLLLEAFDWLWLAMVLSSILLILLTGWPKALFASLFAAMHLGMFLTMRLGLFPLVSVAALLAFLPTTAWDAVEDRARGTFLGRLDIASRRGRFARALPERRISIPADVRRWTRRGAATLVVCLLALILVWNAATLGYVDPPDGATSIVDPGERRWDMFAPEPRTDDGWYVVPARTASGEEVDALHGSAVTGERPPELADTYPSHRWFVYLLDVRRAGDDLRGRFAGYLCERWNATHDDGLTNVTAYYVEQPARLDGPEPTRRVEIVRRSCAAGQ